MTSIDPDAPVTTIDDLMALPQTQLDFQHSPSKSAKDATGVLTRMVADTTMARNNPDLAVAQGVPYGPGARQTLDIFRPASGSAAFPCFIFIHGGFWQEGSTDVSGFAAQTLCDLGWVYISLGYTLTPEAGLTQITREICDAVDFVAAHADIYDIDPSRIVLCGHSAGAHLTACVVADLLGTRSCTHLAAAVMVSGVYDLAPVAKSYVNDVAGITKDEAAALSPLFHDPKCDIPLHLLIGSDEPAAFQVQTDALGNKWESATQKPALMHVQGRDHFDVLNEFSTPGSPILKALSVL